METRAGRLTSSCRIDPDNRANPCAPNGSDAAIVGLSNGHTTGAKSLPPNDDKGRWLVAFKGPACSASVVTQWKPRPMSRGR